MKSNPYEFHDEDYTPTVFHHCIEEYPNGIEHDAAVRFSDCPGYPTCYRVFESVWRLANRLVLQSIGFANAKIDQPNQVMDFFNGAYAPSTIPRLREVREVQRSHREWLSLSRDAVLPPYSLKNEREMCVTGDDNTVVFSAPSFDKVDSYVGLADQSPFSAHIVAEPFATSVVKVTGTELIKDEDGEEFVTATSIETQRFKVGFYYRIVNASLKELTLLARGFILQYEMKDKIHQCARDGCDNIFIDQRSRGNPRKYCKTDECEKIIAAERVAQSRKKKKRSAKKKRSKK